LRTSAAQNHCRPRVQKRSPSSLVRRHLPFALPSSATKGEACALRKRPGSRSNERCQLPRPSSGPARSHAQVNAHTECASSSAGAALTAALKTPTNRPTCPPGSCFSDVLIGGYLLGCSDHTTSLARSGVNYNGPRLRCGARKRIHSLICARRQLQALVRPRAQRELRRCTGIWMPARIIVSSAAGSGRWRTWMT
jgi:hypothetical protein